MVSIVLLTIIITTVLQIQQNNIFYLEKFKNSALSNSYISLGVESFKEKRNDSFYLDEKINMNDDETRKEFKSIKISVKDTEDQEITLPKNDYIQTAQIFKSIYNIKDNTTKVFYTFKLEN